MALSASPSRSEIYAEFSTGLQSTFPNRNLKDMHAQYFGGTGAGYAREDFANLSKPQYVQSGISEDHDSIHITLEHSIAGTSYFRAQYHADDGQPPFSGQTVSTTAYESVTGVQNFAVIDITGLAASTTYWIRIQYYNGFGTSTNPFTDSAFSHVTDAPPSFPQPVITSASHSFGNSYTVQWDYTNSPQPDTWSSQYRINGGTWTDYNGLSTSNNWNSSSNPKSATWTMDVFLDPGDTLEVRIQADASDGLSASAWSPAEEAIFV